MKDIQIPNQDHLKHIVLDDHSFSTLIQCNLSELDIISLSFNTSLNPKQISVLFQKDIANANINLLRNPLCPLEKIRKFLNQKDKIYNIAIASNTALPLDIFKTLVSYNDFDVDIAIAFNPNSPQEILKTLQEKENEQINFALSQNSTI